MKRYIGFVFFAYLKGKSKTAGLLGFILLDLGSKSKVIFIYCDTASYTITFCFGMVEKTEYGVRSHGVRSHGVRSHGVRSHEVRSHGVRSHGVRSHGVRSHGVRSQDGVRSTESVCKVFPQTWR